MAKNLFTARFRWLSALPLLLVTILLAFLAISTLAQSEARTGGSRDRLFDFYQRVMPAPASVSPFHVVEIDRESVEKIGPWPWPRSLLADIVDQLAANKAAGVVLVEPIDAPDPLSPETIGGFWLSGARDAGLAAELARLPSTDAMLARALAQTTGAIAIDPGADVRFADLLTLSRADAGKAPTIALAGGRNETLGLPSAKARFAVDGGLLRSAGLTVSAIPLDADGKARSIPLLWSAAGVPTPLSGLEAARMASGAPQIGVVIDETNVRSVGQQIRQISVGARRVDVEAASSMRIYMARRPEIASTSAWRILDPATSSAPLTGKVVLVGLDREIGGAIATPRGGVSRPAFHALIAQQVLSGTSSIRPAYAGYVEALLVMVLGAAAIMWSQRLDFWKAVGIAALVSAALFATSAIAFGAGRLLLDPLPAVLGLFLGAVSVSGGRSVGAVLKDDSVRGSFQGALPEPTMKRLREEGAAELLDGAYRSVTVMACELRLLEEDLEKFTARPQDLSALMAMASGHLRKSIIDAGGAADQADGGKIFAYFNAPLENEDHTRTACTAALRLIEGMDRVNAELEASPRSRGVQVHLAIGIAVGDCFVGPMGYGKTNRYSAVGATVELASFLRRQAEYYGPAIICDETVHKRTHHHFAFLELDRLKIRDSGRPFSVYALVGNPFLKSSKGYRSLEDAQRQLLAAYREGDWAAARNQLQRARTSPGSRIALYDIYEQRISRMANNTPPDGWDGTTVVTI